MSQTDQLIDNAKSYAQRFDKGDLPLPPGKRVAVLACMDARLTPYGILGLEEIVLIPHTDNVRGFVYEVDTGELHGVSRQPALRS
jgi:hypothetical protein